MLIFLSGNVHNVYISLSVYLNDIRLLNISILLPFLSSVFTQFLMLRFLLVFHLHVFIYEILKYSYCLFILKLFVEVLIHVFEVSLFLIEGS